MVEIVQGNYGRAQLIREPQHDLTPELSGGSAAVITGYYPGDGSKGWMWNPSTMQGHALSFGTTRSGKGTTAIIPALLTYTGSMVVIDPKGENAWVTAERRRQLGQRVVILDPWDEVNRRYAGGRPVETVTKFNPLSTLRPDDPDFADSTNVLGEALIISSSTGNDAHWTESARELIKGSITVLSEAAPGRASLREVRNLMIDSTEDLSRFLNAVAAKHPQSRGVRLLRRFTLDNNETHSVRSVGLTQTSFLDSQPLLDSMQTDEAPFDLAELATGKVTLYLVLPLDRLESHGRWLRMILTLAIRAISRQAEPPKIPVMFLLDEFGTVGALRMIETAFGLLRGVGVTVWAFLQDLSQLQRDYPHSWETFIANTAMTQVLNARDNRTSEYFAKMAGEYSHRELEYETQKLGGAPRLFPEKEVQKPLLYPDDIRRADPDTSLLFYAGSHPVVTARTPYFKIPAWQGRGLYRPLPGFPDTSTPRAPEPPPEPKKKGWGFGR